MNNNSKHDSTEPMHPDRLFPADPGTRAIARRLYNTIGALPIISPHGHTDPRWFADNAPFSDPVSLLLTPDHYITRMLYSQGLSLEELGVTPLAGQPAAAGSGSPDPRATWRKLAAHYHLFRGTPTRLWLDWVLSAVFEAEAPLTAANADRTYDRIAERLAQDAFRPRALFDRFGIEVLATTESPLDDLAHHAAIGASGWKGRIISAYRPDPVVDPEAPGFAAGLQHLAAITGEDTSSWSGYLAAHRARRAFFAQMGATSTDHGHPSASTADLSEREAESLFGRVLRGARSGAVASADAELFRAQMLTEMARMSVDDGLVLQIHPGSWRNHNTALYERFGANVGGDIPMTTDYVRALRPLLNRFGNERSLTLIVFTLDETAYSRELAPLAGHYPALKLGPAWWFHDSPEGLMRFREQTTETAGFYNTVGFNDDTRAFLSIPARHDVARRIDCAFLARLVAEHRLPEEEAVEVARDLAYNLPKRAYKL
ncbi:MAG TPA: glucuronate isomerase [Steroidobacteraceae bacterium]|nr:glucuronate isomerase [Steroidobacteraceae bacterium]